MKFYQIEHNTLTLHVKKAPLFVRITMFAFSILCFILPLAGIVASVSFGSGLKFGLFFGMFIFGLLGFYLLRLSLWNTYGKEIISLDSEVITYYADYRWFKGALKSATAVKPTFLWNPVGYVEDQQACLVIEADESSIESVVKMPISEIETLIKNLNETF
ncbi:hypothetical protein [uncultured Psychroserpens sp.]|uniref:hypothetical protein n=1 Tax=uncultured Psychroserpens sp. TaxID=255436 RepID=UPI00260EDA3D|nr:hypothetical protein [uncultured Psychroserpens sp.]